MQLPLCIEGAFEDTILENMAGSSKLVHMSQNAMKNEPIDVVDNSSMANSENIIAQYLIRNQSSSLYSLADLMMIRMQWAIPYQSLTPALSFGSKHRDLYFFSKALSLGKIFLQKEWNLGANIVKDGDSRNRFKCLKHSFPVESGALLRSCSLSGLIYLNAGCQNLDPIISGVEGELDLVQESKGAYLDDLDVERRALKILRYICGERLPGSDNDDVPIFLNNSPEMAYPGEIIWNCFNDLKSAKQGKTRNGNELAQVWRQYAVHSKMVRTELQETVLSIKDERNRKNRDKIRKVEPSESTVENVINYCQDIGDYFQKRKNTPDDIVKHGSYTEQKKFFKGGHRF